MTSRRLVTVDSDELTEIAFNARADIEFDGDRAFVRVGATTFVTDVPAEVCS